MTDVRALAMLADALGSDLGFRIPGGARAEFDELGAWEGTRAPQPTEPAAAQPAATGSSLVLASWRLLLGGSAATDGAAALLETAKPDVARLSPATAASSAWRRAIRHAERARGSGDAAAGGRAVHGRRGRVDPRKPERGRARRARRRRR
jgi:hypothetical protein